MSQPENPPAFPPAIGITAAGDVYQGFDGMTLRDWFAGQALAGAMAHHGSYGLGNGPGTVAPRCYEIADAMLAERAK